MANPPNGNAKWIKTLIAFGAIVGAAVAAHTTAFNQINTNTTSIVGIHDDLRKNQQLLVEIAQKLDIDVSVLFSK